MKKNYFLLPLLVTILLVAVGCNPFSEKPDDVLSKMSEAMTSVNSVTYDLKMTTNAKALNTDGTEQSAKSTVKMQAQAATVQENSFSLSDLYAGSKMTADLSSITEQAGISTSIKMKMKLVDSNLYMKIEEYPMLESLIAMDPSMADILTKWVKVSADEATSNNSLLSSALPVFGDSIDISDDQKNEIFELSEFTKFFSIKENLGKEKINDTQTYHYSVVINKDTMVNYMKEVANITNEEQLTDEQISALDQMMSKIVNWPIELWIGTDDYYIRKIKFSPSMTDQDMEDMVNYAAGLSPDIDNSSEDDISLSMDMSIEMILSKFNEEFDVTAPAEEEVFDIDELTNSVSTDLPVEEEIETMSEEELDEYISDLEKQLENMDIPS